MPQNLPEISSTSTTHLPSFSTNQIPRKRSKNNSSKKEEFLEEDSQQQKIINKQIYCKQNEFMFTFLSNFQ